MSSDIARFLGAMPTRKSVIGLDLINPTIEIFVWTIQGDRLVWPLLIQWR
jgi:hypothetical protein